MTIKTFAEAEQVLASTLPGYESRPQQQAMAAFVEQTLAADGHALAEAGCGTGKSLGALIPAILSGKRTIVATATIALQEQYCLAPETRVLTADLRYVPISDVQEGDDLVGFDEERVGNRRRFRTATVLSSERIMRPSYRIIFDDGSSVVASEDHRWLCRRGPNIKWMTTKSLAPAVGARAGSCVVRLFDTWKTGDTYSHGYLAAAFDGEGHLTQKRSTQFADGVTNKLGFAQRDNEMLAEVQVMLHSLDFQYTLRQRPDIYTVEINQRQQMVRALGEIRPKRLLPRFSPDMLGTIPTGKGARVIAKEYLGEVEVVAVQTSTGTFIAEGLASHNCKKDVPFLSEHLGVDFSWALLKGRSNYICKAKTAAPGPYASADVLTALNAELDANPEHTGDREHFVTPVTKDEFAQFATTSAECPGKRQCPFGDVCFAERAKAVAKGSQIVITNTAMLMADLKVRELTDDAGSMLGDFGAVVIDEAHELEEIATGALEETFRPSAVTKLVKEVANYAAIQGSVIKSESQIEQALADVTGSLPSSKVGDKVRLGLTFFIERSDVYVSMIEALRALMDDVTKVTIVRDEKRAETRRAMLVKRVGNQIARYTTLVTAEEADLVRWVETEQQARGQVKVLHFAPIDVAPFLTKWLWSKTPAVLVSATLSVGGSFAFIQDRLGLGDAATLNVGTPFDYETQALLFVPAKELPSPKDRSAWMTYSAAATMELIKSAKGGALLLFTSRSAMVASHNSLAPQIEARGFTVLMQGHGSNKELARTFTEDTHSVLFALKSFFVGVDVTRPHPVQVGAPPCPSLGQSSTRPELRCRR